MVLDIFLKETAFMIKKKKIKRVIILGSSSFIAQSVIKYLRLEKIKIIEISRKKLNLHNKQSISKLKKIVQDDDIIFLAAAKAPVKNISMFNYNMKIIENIMESLKRIHLRKFIYLSSDAVYKDSKKLINEKSICEPDSLHGLMHLAREKYIESFNANKVCIVRPTLVYGLDDPHNGYGPNMFLRKAIKNQNIFLFGKGEERRDHVHVEDVGKTISFLILSKLKGKFNITSGNLLSFNQIALMTQKIINPKINIEYIKRNGPMPHNGYRALDNKKILKCFKGFKFKKVNEWLLEL